MILARAGNSPTGTGSAEQRYNACKNLPQRTSGNALPHYDHKQGVFMPPCRSDRLTLTPF